MSTPFSLQAREADGTMRKVMGLVHRDIKTRNPPARGQPERTHGESERFWNRESL